MPSISNTRGTYSRAFNLDPESQAMLYNGLNTSQLAIAFKMSPGTVTSKLATVPHDMIAQTGQKVPLWKIHTAAPYLMKPAYDIENYIKKMSHNELPPMLTKEFWAAKVSRQNFELRAGQLWRTSEVIEKVGEIFKLVSMTAKLAADNIERNTVLTDQQRKAVNQILQQMCVDLQTRITRDFKPVPQDVSISDQQGIALGEEPEVY